MIIELTESASTYLKDMLSKTDKKYATLAVTGGGCSGFKYEWGFADDPGPFTVIDDILMLHPYVEMYLAGSTIDYVQELGGSYLTVINPNATASCGCGESFAI